MAVALTIVDIDSGQKSQYVVCLLTFSGSYATGGDTVDLTTVSQKERLGRVTVFGKVPLYGFIGGTSGHSYGFIPGTTLANGKVKINTAAATELAAGAYPAAITGDANIYAEFAFDEML